MKPKTIIALRIEPGKAPVTVTLATDLDSLQKAVSIGTDYQGLIEILPFEGRIDLLCNEEGKLNGMDPNRRVGDDILFGVFYVLASTPAGNFTSLNQKEIEKYTARFAQPEKFTQEELDALVLTGFTAW